MKTRFQYKSIMHQIKDWREKYILEYSSYPTVITMDPESMVELSRHIFAERLTHVPFPSKMNTEDYIMGMMIEVSDE